MVIMDLNKLERMGRRETALDVRSRAQDALDKHFYDQPIRAFFGADDQSPTGFGVKIKVEKDERLDYSPEEIENAFPTEMTGYTPESNPDKREGIPITIEEFERTLLSSNYESRDYDPVPGGQKIKPFGIPGGTLMGTFHSNEYGDGWATAGHVPEENGKIVEEVIGGGNREPLGQARDVVVNGDIDCCFIEPYSSASPTDEITSSDNSFKELDIDGFYEDSALNYNEGTGFEVEMQGRTSGRQTGELTDFDPTTGSVQVDYLMDDGDSGGPMFTFTGDSAYMVGVMHSKSDLFGYTEGTTVETMEDELGGYVY